MEIEGKKPVTEMRGYSKEEFEKHYRRYERDRERKRLEQEVVKAAKLLTKTVQEPFPYMHELKALTSSVNDLLAFESAHGEGE